MKEGRPAEISTSTSTITPSRPTMAQLITLASMALLGTMLQRSFAGVNEGELVGVLGQVIQ